MRAFLVLAILASGCAQTRSPPVKFPGPCGSIAQCYLSALEKLDDAYKRLEQEPTWKAFAVFLYWHRRRYGRRPPPPLPTARRPIVMSLPSLEESVADGVEDRVSQRARQKIASA
jgi:hypothetical protein